MTAGETPTIAIRGSGAIGMRHARVLRSLGAHVIVIPERPERVAELEAAGFIAASHTAELPRLDGVVVCTRTAAHRVSATAVPVPVLVEKPLALNAYDGERLLEDAARAGQSVHVGYCLRFNPGIRFVADRLASLGSIEAVDAECFSWLPAWRPDRDYRTIYSAAPEEGGVLRDLSHEIDLLNHLVGPGRCAAAVVDGPRVLDLHPGVDESATLITNHGGVRGTIRLSFARQPESRRLRVFGRHGCLEWDAICRTARHLDTGGRVVESQSWGEPSEMYVAQARAWLGVLRGESHGVLATAMDGLHALRIVDDARASGAAHAKGNPCLY